ncbi:glycosyltransferase [Clostridium estertheticum]|uniref:glycosyltransferase family 2 protein n=1 Tax=Clostridium estertheticum TaxID=238834 RepID=UPI001C0B9644|nr:glycosyltransferase [Clostridium estertheticum]MBU3197727.1 glycosyltransferase [Clostridium estertheticum]WAG65530.1 glycosyltransferase [Clostridium estertheticum]
MITFIILHYNGFNDTVKCIDSILNNLFDKNISVVVVDNNSPNHSGVQLLQKYKDNKLVDILLKKENDGFSKGNNYGCKYAINKYNSDFLCVINNDTYIDDKLICDKIYSLYNKYEFDVIGPKIWNIRRQYNQNPFEVISSLDQVNNELKQCVIAQKILNTKLPLLFYVYVNYLCKNKNKNKELGLNGAALIFSRKYFLKFNKIFPEETFMYGEENLLFYRKIKNNLKFIYNDDIIIFHNDSSSTKGVTKNVIGKWRFQNKYALDALYKLQEIYINNKEI